MDKEYKVKYLAKQLVLAHISLEYSAGSALLFVVRLHVTVKAVPPRKSLIANLTIVWSFSSVDALVLGKSGAIGEALAAVVTTIWAPRCECGGDKAKGRGSRLPVVMEAPTTPCCISAPTDSFTLPDYQLQTRLLDTDTEDSSAPEDDDDSPERSVV